MRIVIVGPSGTGKTTLAQELGKRNNIPFISASAKGLFKCYGFKDHKDIIRCAIENPKKGFDFQMELMLTRNNLFKQYKDFISARSPIDIWVYFLLQNSSQLSGPQCEILYELYLKGLENIDKVIYLPHTSEIDTEEDGVRITNRYFQYMVDSLFDKVIFDLRKMDLIWVSRIYNTIERNFERKLEFTNIWLNG